MSKVVRITEAERRRNDQFNAGYSDAYEDAECQIEPYETDVNYRRGYDAGERDREEDMSGNNFEELSKSERELIYGPDRDEL